VRLVAGERDNAAVAFGCLVVVAFGLVEPAKALVAVMRAGEACQNIAGSLFGLVEFFESEHGIGRVVQLVTAVIAEVRIRTATLYERLAAMTATGLVVKSADGYCLAAR
jgi:hypothetical protein